MYNQHSYYVCHCTRAVRFRIIIITDVNWTSEGKYISAMYNQSQGKGAALDSSPRPEVSQPV